MNEQVRPMRMLNLQMIKGLSDLCMDIKFYTHEKELKIVEVGSYIGESTNIFLNNLNISEITCIDSWEANNKYHINDISMAYELFKAQFKNNSKVHIFKNHSTSLYIPADVVYIDASHKYEDVKADILHWKEKCDDIICGHDYEDKGKFGVKRAVDEIFGKPDKVYKDTSWMVYLNKRK